MQGGVQTGWKIKSDETGEAYLYLSTKLDAKKQSKHTEGTAAYKKSFESGRYPSIVSLSDSETQAVIDRYTKEGYAYARKDGSIRVRFTHDKQIGTYSSEDGSVKKVTRKGQIHYSKTGAHVVPDEP